MRADIDAAVQSGTVLGGRYLLREDLGSGGSAVVHAADDRKLGRRVAVKTLRTGLCTDPELVRAFLREARVAAGLNHPGVVAVHDVGDDNVNGIRVPWMVLEYVEGPTVRELLANGPMPPGQALSLLADVLAALQHSHDHGVVHRDISPGNVMVTWQRQVKVADFGIAAAVGDRTGSDLRRTGATVKGTAAFLSPEQAQGRPVDGRSDLYSAGCLLFALLTGRPPFVGADADDMLWQHVNQEPLAPSHVRSEIPRPLDRVVLTALAKRPDQRYPDAKAMHAAVLAARDSLDSGQAAATPEHLADQVAPDQVAPDQGAPDQVARDPFAPESLAPEHVVREQGLLDHIAPGQVAVGADDVTQVRSPAPISLLPIGSGSSYQPDAEGELPPLTLRQVADRAVQAVRGVVRGDVDQRTGLVALLLVACLAAGGVAWWISAMVGNGREANATGGSVVVPTVAGTTVDNATDRLAAVGLRAGSTRVVHSDSVRLGHVIRTDPPAGTRMSRRARVDLVVSGGSSRAVVPDLQGHTLPEARKLLLAQGLDLRSVVDRDSAYQAGRVLTSTPSSGAEVAAGSAVAVVIASGWSRVPDVRGLAVGDARKLLVAAGFKAGPVTSAPASSGNEAATSGAEPAAPRASSSPRPRPGTIAQARPAIGSRARVGSVVTLITAGLGTGTGVPEPQPGPAPGQPAPGPTKPTPHPSPTPSHTTPAPTPSPTHPSNTPTPTPSPTTATPTPTPKNKA